MTDLSTRSWVEQLVSSIPSGLLILSDELRIRQANSAFGAIFGVDPHEIRGHVLDDIVSVDGLREQALAVLESGQPLEKSSCQWWRGDDEVCRLEISLEAIEADDDAGALLLIVDDHTEREELRTRARLSEGGFREVIEHSPDGICVHRDGQFLYINPSLMDLFEIDRAEEVIGTSVYDFVHPDEYPDLQRRVRQLLDGAEHVPVRETRLLRRDGAQWVAELTARRVIFDGEPAIASIARDITERKELTAQMMQMDRMIAAGTLAAGVGHEINNPLTYVSGNIDFALECIDEIDRSLAPSDNAGASQGLRKTLDSIREALRDAHEGGTRIRDIVSQLRTFSPDEDDAREAIAVDEIIESVLGMVANEIRHRAKLVMEIGAEPPIYGNENKLGQVFLNLLINAAHAIEGGAFEDNEIRVRTEVDDAWVVVEIYDSGSGISSEELSRIFDPFFTTKPVGQGTGLGLYICQRIVESHGGRIEVESEPGVGTIVRTHLPRALEADLQVGSSGESVRPTSGPGAQILIIDDEEMIGRLIARTLRDDHQVTTLTSARQAIEHLEEGQTFDLILCDLMMPDITGMDFHQHVAEHFPQLLDTIAFITGGAFTPRALEFLEQTDNACLDKPLDADELRDFVRDRLELTSGRASR
jgi:PAS domain S-box-containing protein